MAQFDATVFVDYSSMSGAPGTEVAAKDLVASWQALLSDKEITHHMLTNIEMSTDETTAEISSHVYARHRADVEGVADWDIYGRYRHTLRNTADGWKITAMTLLVDGQRGNRNFLQEIAS